MKFEIYRDNNQQYRWRLLANNGRIVADSGESYTRREDAARAATMVRRDVAKSKVIDA